MDKGSYGYNYSSTVHSGVERFMANLQIIFRECGNSSMWVSHSGKILQICRFAGYVGNGLIRPSLN